MNIVIQNQAGQFLSANFKWVSEYPDAVKLRTRRAAANLALRLPSTAGLRIVRNYGLESATVLWDANNDITTRYEY